MLVASSLLYLALSNPALQLHKDPPVRTKYTFHSFLTVQSAARGKEIGISVSVPPNLPTQQLESQVVTFEGATITSGPIRATMDSGGQDVLYYRIRLDFSRVELYTTCIAKLWLPHVNGLSNPEAKFPNFVSSGTDRVGLDYQAPEFQNWLNAEQLTKGSDESWADYIRRVYTVFKGKWHYAKSSRGPANVTCKTLIGLKSGGCQDASMLLVAILRNQGIPAVRMYGAVEYPTNIGAHNEVYAQLDGVWTLLNPTSGFEGLTDPNNRSYFFTMHATQLGRIKVNGADVTVSTGWASSFMSIEAGNGVNFKPDIDGISVVHL